MMTRKDAGGSSSGRALAFHLLRCFLTRMLIFRACVSSFPASLGSHRLTRSRGSRSAAGGGAERHMVTAGVCVCVCYLETQLFVRCDMWCLCRLELLVWCVIVM